MANVVKRLRPFVLRREVAEQFEKNQAQAKNIRRRSVLLTRNLFWGGIRRRSHTSSMGSIVESGGEQYGLGSPVGIVAGVLRKKTKLTFFRAAEPP